MKAKDVMLADSEPEVESNVGPTVARVTRSAAVSTVCWFVPIMIVVWRQRRVLIESDDGTIGSLFVAFSWCFREKERRRHAWSQKMTCSESGT